MTKKAIIIEDQPILWDYAKSCIEKHFEVIAYCATTEEAEAVFKKEKIDFVWLDCYLGEMLESYQGLKQSGLILASWIKNHFPLTKILLFTASTELSLLKQAQELQLEGIALGAKYLKDKSIILEGINEIVDGKHWICPNLIQNFEMELFSKITVFELSILIATIYGKQAAQIAEELNTTRKTVNNALYRIKQKLEIDPYASRDQFLESCKEKLRGAVSINSYFSITEFISMQAVAEQLISPIISQLRDGQFIKQRLKN
ncbi:MAG: response regulator [Candidatus Caenarcaniphilales bacterium]|jgi:DNA-binding NarL/FixJ family response regulator|nr:response regulator [Candidatus Caenarcaniphilales bacterium]